MIRTISKQWIIQLIIISVTLSQTIPLPEHPRPDFKRQQWLNLNGQWQFSFDKENIGVKEKWFEENKEFEQKITVPFSWGSQLSGVKDEADIGWYRRKITIPQSWPKQRVFLIIGACDWHTTAWLNGELLGEHKGGYTPFEFELTPYVQSGQTYRITIRVDDTTQRFKLRGKQGYGRAAGIWQTVYLETRPQLALKYIHFTPDIDQEIVSIKAYLDKPALVNSILQVNFKEPDLSDHNLTYNIPPEMSEFHFDVSLNSPRLWSLADPFLYEVDVLLLDGKGNTDRVSTYFGMRKISVMDLPGTDIPYIALNNKPIYLQMALDQAFHPQGFYTFPSDEFMRDEILRTRRLGLNGQRIHVKTGIPRKLYWADRLGVLIQADVPNSGGPADEQMRKEIEKALSGMILRDYNHPAIFSWVNFNETWGLRARGEGYTKETQDWVASIYNLTKQLDPTRLVEDNSTNNHDHVISDINSWHAYLPGHRWNDVLDLYSTLTFPGSGWNYINENKQNNEPMMNSECGNVWGYEGPAGGAPTGDIDWSWDYHQMMNAFRRFPKVCGWIYTEHHDVINEWNGYYRYDRSLKFTGIPELNPGMKINDLHSDFYLASEKQLCRKVAPGETIDVPLYASFMSADDLSSELTLKTELFGWDVFGQKEYFSSENYVIPYSPWMNKELQPLKITMPDKTALAVLGLTLQSISGEVLHRNFTTYLVAESALPRKELVTASGQDKMLIRFAPNSFKKAKWSLKKWDILNGLKVNGAGYGYFDYQLPWPEGLSAENITDAFLLLELSAKRLYGKDLEDGVEITGDFMLGQGTLNPSKSPNSYPMTDENPFPSAVRVYIADAVSGVFDLQDDPADHRGILSWFSQKRDYNKPVAATSFRAFKGGELHEAGSYGYLVQANISKEALSKAEKMRQIEIRLEVDDTLPGGLAIYGERFGRYPFDPTIIFMLKK